MVIDKYTVFSSEFMFINKYKYFFLIKVNVTYTFYYF